MLRLLVAAVAAAVVLAGCGHGRAGLAGASQPSADSAALGAYVVDSGQPPSPAPAAAPAGPAAQPATCSSGQKAYEALVAITSSDTGQSVRQITGELQQGQSLDQVAGAKSPEVRQQALGLVVGWLRFAVANGRITQQQADQYTGGAAVVIDALMKADVAACVPST